MGQRTCVQGMGENIGEKAVLGAEDGGDDIIDAEVETQPVDSLPFPSMPT